MDSFPPLLPTWRRNFRDRAGRQDAQNDAERGVRICIRCTWGSASLRQTSAGRCWCISVNVERAIHHGCDLLAYAAVRTSGISVQGAQQLEQHHVSQNTTILPNITTPTLVSKMSYGSSINFFFKKIVQGDDDEELQGRAGAKAHGHSTRVCAQYLSNSKPWPMRARLLES